MVGGQEQKAGGHSWGLTSLKTLVLNHREEIGSTGAAGMSQKPSAGPGKIGPDSAIRG